MNFSLERVFVVPTGNTVPTTGKSSDLTPNQFGVFLPNLTPATAVNIAAADYVILAQQRANADLNLPTIKSDKIATSKIIKKYKVVGAAGAVQIGELSGFDAKCDETISVSIRAYEEDVLMTHTNGYTKTFTKKTPCCDCDGNPCDSIEPADLQALIEEIRDDINADTILSKLLVATTTGSGATVKLVITGLAQVDEPSADLTVNHYRANATSFRLWAYRGAPTTQDAIDFDGCDSIGTYATTQQIKFAKGASAQVALSEYKHFSYTVPNFKERFSDVNFNGIFHSNVVAGTVYNQFVIQFNNYENPNTWSHIIDEDSTVILWIPQALSSAIEAILVAKFGAFTEI